MAREWYKIYDSVIDSVCPDYKMGLEAVVNAIPSNAKNIVELGSGTGELTYRIAQTYPNTNIVGVDINIPLLDIAKYKSRSYGNVRLLNLDILGLDFAGFDTIVSGLVFHLLPQHYRDVILERMVSSQASAVVIFDRVKGETQEKEKTFLEYFAHNLQGKRLAQDLIEELIKESRINKPMKLSKQKKLFEENRFMLKILHQNPNHGFVTYGFYR